MQSFLLGGFGIFEDMAILVNKRSSLATPGVNPSERRTSDIVEADASM
jgi:hypothetical protein